MDVADRLIAIFDGLGSDENFGTASTPSHPSELPISIMPPQIVCLRGFSSDREAVSSEEREASS